ncbi:MAG: hypothetical protein M5U26_23165 [Planctomycetota bacterium]|nr:hypothetical protein [Planctomycetota bacterium]
MKRVFELGRCGCVVDLDVNGKPVAWRRCSMHRAAPSLLAIALTVREALDTFQTEDADYLTVERVAELLGGLDDAIAYAKPKGTNR